MSEPLPGDPASLRNQARKLAKLSSSAWDKDKDLESAVETFKEKRQTWAMFWGLSYRAIGVVYGDLGTSPLYTYPTVFSKKPSRLAIYGSCSLILWILMLQLILKYICVTLYADDNGEGGTFAMYSLLCRHIGITPFGKEEASDSSLSAYTPRSTSSRRQDLSLRCSSFIKGSTKAQFALLMLVLLGTSMLLGDGVLTCAIEVTSAVSGLELKTHVSQGVIVGVTCAILVGLFSIQFLGTSKIGIMFSPILLVWFATNAALGIYNIAKFDTGILAAFNPAYGFRYLVSEGRDAWISLGGIILCVTGAESMFNDMGHFSRPAIQFTTLAMVLPSCMLTYLGEAAFLVERPTEFANPYFAAVPSNLFWPVFGVATAGSIVAAQSLITATFSIVKQSIALNCFPPVKIVQTSSSVAGQVYLPFVNWALMVGSIGVVAAFQTTARIGNAFGVAFISVMMVSTALVSLVQLIVWRLHPLLPLIFCAFFLALEGVPASALLYKFPHGAWFPVALAVVIICISYLWHYGCSQKLAHAAAHAKQLSSLLRTDPSSEDQEELVLVEKGRKVTRLPGLAMYHAEGIRGLPEAFVHLLRKMPAVHQNVIFMTVRQVPLPSTSPEERFLIRPLQLPGFFRVVARYGYLDFVDQGSEFVADLTARIAALVRFNSLTGVGSPGLTVDSAAEIPHVDLVAGLPLSISSTKQLGSDLLASQSETGQKALEGASGLGTDSQAEPSSRNSGPASEQAEEAGVRKRRRETVTDVASQILRSPEDGVVYILSKSTLLARPGSGFLKKFVLEALYPLLLRNSRPPTASWKIPRADIVEVGVILEA